MKCMKDPRCEHDRDCLFLHFFDDTLKEKTRKSKIFIEKGRWADKWLLGEQIFTNNIKPIPLAIVKLTYSEGLNLCCSTELTSLMYVWVCFCE